MQTTASAADEVGADVTLAGVGKNDDEDKAWTTHS
jgi:hypothetical protein